MLPPTHPAHSPDSGSGAGFVTLFRVCDLFVLPVAIDHGKDQLQWLPLSARDHSAGDLAVFSVQPTRRRERKMQGFKRRALLRGSTPSMPPPTIRSTFNAISFQQKHTELFEPQQWTRGARPLLQHERGRQRDRSRLIGRQRDCTRPCCTNAHKKPLPNGGAHIDIAY